MKKTLAILAVSPVLCAYAWGGAVQQRLPDSPYQDGGQVRASGEELKFGVVRGTGQDVPLYKALTSIIPRGYTLRTVGVERWLLDEPVTWVGGREWTEVLSDAISNYPELTVDIATGSKVVILRQTYSQSDGGYAQHAFAVPAAQKTLAPWSPASAMAEPAPPAKTAKAAKAAKNAAPLAEPVAYAAPPLPASGYDAGPYMDTPRQKQARPVAEGMPNAAVTQRMDVAAEPMRKQELVKVADASRPGGKGEIAAADSPAKTQWAAAPQTGTAQNAEAGVTWPAIEKALESAQTVRVERANAELVVTKAELEAVKAELVNAKAGLKGTKSEPTTAAKQPDEKIRIAAAKAELAIDKQQLAAARTNESAPAVPAAPKPVWDIKSADKTLKSSIERWASTSGWQVSWELLVDYPVEATASITGTFEEAVEAVIKSMDRAEIPMKAIFYNGNKVLRIVAKGNE